MNGAEFVMHAHAAAPARPESAAPLQLPLAAVQRGLWFVQQLAPDTAAYNLVFAARIVSALDEAAYAAAVQRLVDRHGALRTRFVTDAEHAPRQQILPHATADTAVVAAEHLDDAALRAAVLDETRAPFDLAHAPLLRVRLYRRGGADAVMVWTAHHIAVDFWSLAVLLDEFRTLYAALAAGRTPVLPPLGADYPAYVRRQQALLDGIEGERLWAYWRERLGGELPLLDLAGDFPRPAVQRYRGASLGFRLDAALTAALRGLARAEGVTPYVLLLAAYGALLHRYTGQHDILVGSPVAGRNDRRLRATVGQFVNTVVLRVGVSGDDSFRALLQRTQTAVADAMRHQDFPFATLVERLLPERDLGRPPLFQAGFSWERLPQLEALAGFFALNADSDAAVEFGELRLQPYPLPQQEGQVELALEMGGETAGGLFGTWKYNSDLYAAETVAALARHFVELLQGIVADPAQTVARLPLLGAAERDTVLYDGNHTAQPLPAAATVHELVAAQAAYTPDRVAVRGGDLVYSYRVLNQRANQIAHYLIEQGIAAGQRVGICCARTPDMVAALLAVLKTGAAYVPLDPALPRERLAAMVEDAAVAVVLTHAAVWAESPLPGVRPLLLDAEWPVLATYPAHNPARMVAAEAAAYVIFTSGSTGRPKGVVVPQRAVVNFLAAMAREPGLAAHDVVLAVTTLAFDIAVLELLLPLTVGACTVLASRETAADARALRALLDDSGATLMQATPATWRMLLADGWDGKADLTALCGGEALPRPLADALLPRVAALWNMYGPTETTVWSTVARVAPGSGAVAIGRPIANTRVYILDEALQPVPAGVAGELCIAGIGVAAGYLHRAELTAQKFLDDPFVCGERLYRTGDLARRRRDGMLECLGRVDHQVKLRGYRIELGEIEHALCAHAAVREAVALLRDDAAGEPRLTAYVTTAEPAPAPAELKALLAARLPAYMLPTHIVVLERLPLTPNGKVDRRALPAPAAAAAAGEWVPPRDAFEIRLAALWEQLLHVHPVGIHQDFFALGGHSLLAVQLVAAIRARFGVELPVATLFRHGTVAALARLLRDGDGVAQVASPLVPLRSGGERPPLFLLHPIGGTVFCYLALARHLTARPLYAVQSPGLDDAGEAEVTVPALARRYLELLRAAQPHGPYHLGGWCFGGVVAYEVARQLRAAGDEVAELVLFDSRAPIPENAPADADDATLLSWFARDLAVPYGRRQDIAPAQLRALSDEDMFEHVLRRAREIEVLPADADAARLRRYFEVYLANGIALQTYEAGDYTGPMTLFRAQHEPADYGPRLGWERVVSRPFAVVDVPGDHNSMMYEPHVRALARHVDHAEAPCRALRAAAG